MNARPLPGFDTPKLIDRTNPNWHIKHIFYGDYVFTSETICKKNGDIKDKFKNYTPIQVPAMYINTFSPRDVMAIHCPLPCLPAPKESYEAKRVRRSAPCTTPDVIRLPAPIKAYPVAVGDTLPLAGFAQVCTVTAILEKWGQTWVTVQAQIGKHTMTKTVDISQIIPNGGE